MTEPKVAKLPLGGKNKGKFALVDFDAFYTLRNYRWHCNDEGYVIRSDGERLAHVIILHWGRHEVDHVNGNTLDNRRSNLRLATRRLNIINRPSWGEIEFKGVRKNARGDAKASIHYEGEEFRLGTYPTPEAAAVAYDSFAAYFYGEFARLNFPESTPLHPRIAQNLRTRLSIKRGGDLFDHISARIHSIELAESLTNKAV